MLSATGSGVATVDRRKCRLLRGVVGSNCVRRGRDPRVLGDVARRGEGTVFAGRQPMAHDNLRSRTFLFAVSSIRAAKPLVHDPVGRHLVGQLFRAAGSVAANYDGACHARSRRDFASKISIVAEEASESSVWFRIFVALELLAEADVGDLITEAGELAAIATASARTASRPRRD